MGLQTLCISHSRPPDSPQEHHQFIQPLLLGPSCSLHRVDPSLINSISPPLPQHFTQNPLLSPPHPVEAHLPQGPHGSKGLEPKRGTNRPLVLHWVIGSSGVGGPRGQGPGLGHLQALLDVFPIRDAAWIFLECTC